MIASLVDRHVGRSAFGGDSAGYLSARPRHPEWLHGTLRERCGLQPGTAAFEIGAGPGTATRRLLDLGANPLVAVEPDPALASLLRIDNSDDALEVHASPFEDVVLPASAFDLGFCATAFHWLDEDEDEALAKVGRLLRPGGWWAMAWNEFGDPGRPDPVHDATQALLGGPLSVEVEREGIPFGLDVEARRVALERSEVFDAIADEAHAWTLELDMAGVVALYSTFFNVATRSDADACLAGIERIARDEFGGRVIRNMTTNLYVARRRHA